MSLPYFNFYPTDFEAKTSHLTMVEDGAYNRLLRLCWMTPGCSLPDDEAWIMRRVRAFTDGERAAVVTILAEFFEVENGRLFSPRLRKEAMLSTERHARRVEAGKKGGRPVASLKTNDNKESIAKAEPKQPEPEPEPEPEPLREEANASLSTDVDAPSFADFWKAWPLARVQKAKAEAAFKRLSAENKRLATDRAKAWGEAWRKKHPTASDIHPTSYLNSKRWQDEMGSALSSAPVDIRQALADRIKSGKPWNVRDISSAQVRDLIAAGLVTPEDCRKAGVQ